MLGEPAHSPGEYELSLRLLSDPILKLRKDKGRLSAFVIVQPRCVLLFPDLTVDF